MVPGITPGTSVGCCMEKELEFYRTHLASQVLPFWEKAFDEEYGGVFTCFSNDGDTLLSQDKYTWSQARMLWCLSCLVKSTACCVGLSEDRLKGYREAADKLYIFLDSHAWLSAEDEVVAFLLDRTGKQKESIPGKGLYTSFYADCFLIMAYSRYSLLSDDASIAKKALSMYRKMLKVLSGGIVKTEPYPLPAGAEAHSVQMILCNTAHELSLALMEFYPEEASGIAQEAEHFAHTILERFVDKQSLQVQEVILSERQNVTLLERHRNPGHTVESMWFCLDVLNPEYHMQLGQIVTTALDLGWDTEYGGLFRFVDQDGGKVSGDMDGSSFARLVADTWDYKLWWPHSEALYASLRLYLETADETFFSWYKKLKAYTFSTFPGESAKEWVQIRKRDGTPEEKVVALPVKDPYHILRMLLLIIETLDKYIKDKKYGL